MLTYDFIYKKQSSYDLHVFSKKKILLSHYIYHQIIQSFIFIWNIFNVQKRTRYNKPNDKITLNDYIYK